MTVWLPQWATGAGLVDAIIALTLVEITVLLLYHHQTKRGLAPLDYLLNVISGLCLMLALRCAMSGNAWYFISAFLLAAGFAHVTDIVLRLRKRKQTT